MMIVSLSLYLALINLASFVCLGANPSNHRFLSSIEVCGSTKPLCGLVFLLSFFSSPVYPRSLSESLCSSSILSGQQSSPSPGILQSCHPRSWVSVVTTTTIIINSQPWPYSSGIHPHAWCICSMPIHSMMVILLSCCSFIVHVLILLTKCMS